MKKIFISDANTGEIIPILIDERGFICVKCDAMDQQVNIPAPIVNIPPITVPTPVVNVPPITVPPITVPAPIVPPFTIPTPIVNVPPITVPPVNIPAPIINVPPITIPPITVNLPELKLLKSGSIILGGTTAIQITFDNLNIKRVVVQSSGTNQNNTIIYVGTQQDQSIELTPTQIYTLDTNVPIYVRSSAGNRKVTYNLFGY